MQHIPYHGHLKGHLLPSDGKLYPGNVIPTLTHSTNIINHSLRGPIHSILQSEQAHWTLYQTFRRCGEAPWCHSFGIPSTQHACLTNSSGQESDRWKDKSNSEQLLLFVFANAYKVFYIFFAKEPANFKELLQRTRNIAKEIFVGSLGMFADFNRPNISILFQ